MTDEIIIKEDASNITIIGDDDSQVLVTTEETSFTITGGGAPSSFTSLTDTPSIYTGEALKLLRVNSSEDEVEFIAVSTALTGQNISIFNNDSGYITGISSFDIDDLNDVTITSIANNDILVWNSTTSAFENSNSVTLSSVTADDGIFGTVDTAELFNSIGTLAISSDVTLDGSELFGVSTINVNNITSVDNSSPISLLVDLNMSDNSVLGINSLSGVSGNPISIDDNVEFKDNHTLKGVGGFECISIGGQAGATLITSSDINLLNFYQLTGAYSLSIMEGTSTINALNFGSDVNLYRSGANVLTTDDSLEVGVDVSIASNITLTGSTGSGDFTGGLSLGSNIVLPNNTAYQVKTTGGTATDVITLTDFNNVFIEGVTGTSDIILSDASLFRLVPTDNGKLSLGGRDTPLRKLHVFDNGVNNDARIYIEASPSNNGPGIEMGFDETGTIRSLVRTNKVGTDGTEIAFYTKPDSGVLDEFMRLQDSGGLSLGPTYVDTDPGEGFFILEKSVGIGVTAPNLNNTNGGNCIEIYDTGSSASGVQVNSINGVGVVAISSNTSSKYSAVVLEDVGVQKGGLYLDRGSSTLFTNSGENAIVVGTLSGAGTSLHLATEGVARMSIVSTGEIDVRNDIDFQGAGNRVYRAHVHHSYGWLAGQSIEDTGMLGLYDRCQTTNAHLKGSVTMNAITGTATGTVSNLTNSNGNFDTISNLSSDAEIEIIIDTGSLQLNYSSAKWMPFVQYRIGDDSRYSHFKSITVEVSNDGTSYHKPSGGDWETTDYINNTKAPGYWFGGLAVPNSPTALPSYRWRYVKFTFSDLYQGSLYPTKLWLSQIGVRHASHDFAPQYLAADGSQDLLDDLYVYSGVSLVLGSSSIKYDGTDLAINTQVFGSGDLVVTGGSVEASYKSSDGSSGVTGSFVDSDGYTVTVKNGIITDFGV